MGFFKGLLQNVRFYDRAIEPQEVELLYKIDSDKKIIESIYPTSCGSGTPLTTYIKGSGFTKDCIVGLKESVGSRIIYDKKVTFVSPTELIVDWDLPNDAILTYGKYDIQISGFIDGSVQTKSKAFTIKEHIPSILDVNIDGGSNSFGNGALPLQTKLVNDQTGQYRVRIKATGNVPLFNVEESIVIQCLDNDSKLQFFTSPVIQGEKIFGTTQPRSEISYTEGIDDNGFKTYTIIMSKKILYPDEKPELFFSLYSKRAPTKFVIGTQNALKSYNSMKREQACSDCEKCVLDLISAAPGPIGCAASIGGAYCTSLEKPAWYDIIRTIGSATLSCAFPFGNIVGKFSQKVIGAASGGIGALADCQAALRFGCNSSFEGPIEVQVVQRSGIISDDTLRSNTLQTRNTNSNISFNIYGLKGYTNENYVARGQVMPYKIVFNNLSSNDTVNTVIIKEQIDTSIFDISSFSFSNYGFGDTTFILDNTNENFIAYDHDLRPRKNTILRFTAFIDRDSGKIEWHLSSINPNTYDPIVDKKQGFLPPNDSTGKGLGFLEYTIDSKTNLVHGSKIRSQVDVQVDSTLSITTPAWMNTIDAEKPISKIKSLSAISTDTTIQLIFQGSDSGSGIKYYDLFMSENNSPIRRVGTNIKKDTIKFTGTNGRTYAFFSMARDSVGNWEDTTHIADATTKIDIRTPVSEVHSKNIKIYPNPNNGIFLIESPWDDTSIQVSVNDWAGRILTQQKFESKHTVEIQLKNVPFGIYYLSVKNEKTGEIKVAKVVYQ